LLERSIVSHRCIAGTLTTSTRNAMRRDRPAIPGRRLPRCERA
jgi:hypothetical protein